MIKQQVFIVEDDHDDFLFMHEALKYVAPSISYKRFLSAEDLYHFMNAEPGNIPALFIIDYNLPLKNGVDVLKHLNLSDEYKEVPKVFYSNSNFSQYINEAMDSGALAFYTKATNMNDIKKNVLEMLLYSSPSVL